ncbi:TIGR03016 family PEP-CTERM system-associated outer membrane protein [Hydrogenophaga sp.]|uniref:TIGR03016 family PEP-CTERM system-associated outer membrane protein n=1 Tax=Hydrogenophaga sp. TaxID=1904254 RepID=UPI002629DFE2|nr:TIGR03016 family PEP-CTERM system-associated outer membrane protein [Hydrogenophaga sp.]MCW5652263.1 TIGR03016 family PEP-CTERM system-associated outer membrane protein [Hydrogenophaga sp.]
MKNNPKHLPTPRAVAMACLAALSPVLVTPVWAQLVDPSEMRDETAMGEGGPRPSVWIEPRISTGVLITNNGNLSATSPQSEQILEVTPGVRAVFNRPRAKGFFDYSLSTQYRLQNTSGDALRHLLNTAMTFEAVDDRVFVDVSGVVADESISAFGTLAPGYSNANTSRTSSFRVSPYLRGVLAGAVNYELRVGMEKASTATGSRSDVTVQDASARLRSDMTGRMLGWSLDAQTVSTEYTLGRRTRSDQVLGGLNYAPSSLLMLTAQAGVESNDVLSASRENYSITGLSLDWRPSNRTRLVAGVQKRYFGTGYNVLFEHRTARTVWRFSDTRDAVNNPLDPGGATLGTVYSLLDSLYTAQEPDPVRRAQLVQAELLRLGLPADANSINNFLSSSATLVRSQQLSLALVGVRNGVTFTLLRGNSRRLGPSANLGDDFDVSESIRQRSWSVNYSHRLTPLTTFAAGVGRQTNEGSVAGLSNTLTTFTVGATTRLAARTSGTVQLQRSIYDQVGAPYREVAISANITHRF